MNLTTNEKGIIEIQDCPDERLKLQIPKTEKLCEVLPFEYTTKPGITVKAIFVAPLSSKYKNHIFVTF